MTDLRFPVRAALGLGATAVVGVLALLLTFPSTKTLAQMFESDGQLDVATQYSQKWIAEHPSDYEARLHTADLLLMSVHPEQALRTLEAMAASWPDDPQILRRLVDIEDSLLLVDETLPHLERLAALAPGDPGVLRRLADHYRWKGLSQPLLATLLKLVRLHDAPDERAELVDTLLSNRQYETLIAWLSPNVDKLPDPVEMRLALYEAYLRTHRLDEATAQLTRVLELAPERVELLSDVADHLVERGLFDQAVALYRQRIDRDPRHARRFQAELNELYESRAESLAQAGQLDAAVALYRVRISRAPLDVALRLELAELYGARATDVAVAELRDVLARAPTSVEAWVALGERYSWKDDLARAIKAYQQAARLAPGDRAIRRALAQNLAFADRDAEAIEEYRRLVLASGDEVDREALVELYLDADRGADALAEAKKMAASARRGYLVGLAAVAAQDYTLALPELVTWTDRQPSDLRAWRALLECATALDNADLALVALRQVERLERRGHAARRPEL